MDEDTTLSDLVSSLKVGWDLSKRSITSSEAHRHAIGAELMRSSVEMCELTYGLFLESSNLNPSEDLEHLFGYWAEGTYLLGEHNSRLVSEAMKDLKIGMLDHERSMDESGGDIIPNRMTFDPAATSKYLQYVDAAVGYFQRAIEVTQFANNSGVSLDGSFKDVPQQAITKLMIFANDIAVTNEQGWFLEKYSPSE